MKSYQIQLTEQERTAVTHALEKYRSAAGKSGEKLIEALLPKIAAARAISVAWPDDDLTHVKGQ